MLLIVIILISPAGSLDVQRTTPLSCVCAYRVLILNDNNGLTSQDMTVSSRINECFHPLAKAGTSPSQPLTGYLEDRRRCSLKKHEHGSSQVPEKLSKTHCVTTEIIHVKCLEQCTARSSISINHYHYLPHDNSMKKVLLGLPWRSSGLRLHASNMGRGGRFNPWSGN